MVKDHLASSLCSETIKDFEDADIYTITNFKRLIQPHKNIQKLVSITINELGKELNALTVLRYKDSNPRHLGARL